VDEVLAVLDRASRDVGSVSVWSASDASLVGCLDRVEVLAAQVAGLRLALVREVDARGLALGQGAANVTGWLRDRYRISGAAAGRTVRLAAALEAGRSATAAALSAGLVNVEQAQVIVGAVADLPSDVPAVERAAGEEYLLDQAATFGPRELGALGQRLVEVVAPRLAAQRELAALARAEDRAHERRGLWLTDQPGTSQVRLTGWLDRADAAAVTAVLDPLCAPHARTARAAAGGGAAGPGAAGGGGEGAVVGGAGWDARTAGERRLDALIDVCQLACATGQLPTNGGDRPHVVVTMDFDVLRAQLAAATLDDGSPLSPATARRMACDAAILPAVLAGPSQILDLGRERRLFTGPLRRALILRDGGCAFPGCDRPPRWCNGHHIVHWADGGPTTLTNAVLLCRRHHRLIHHSDWQVRINPTDGRPEFIPPHYIDPNRRPQRNPYHHRE
jgi:hypothetical protein